MITDVCNVCGGRLEQYLSEVKDPQTGEVFSVLRCMGCGLGHTMPCPDDVGRYYVAQYYGNRHGFTLRYCLRRRLRFVSSPAQRGGGGKLLDIGCGDGSFLLAARSAGWDVMGTELNPEPGRAAGIDVKDSVDEIPGEGVFDCITMWHSLEHMRDISAMMENLARLIKPDGRVIIAVPDFGGLQSLLFRRHWLHIDVPRHLYHFDTGALEHALSSVGLSIEKRWHQEFEYDLLGWSQSALNAIMPSHPNHFFELITGKRTSRDLFSRVTSYAMGVLTTVISLPLLAAGTLMGRGGTLVVAARPTAKVQTE